MWKTIVKMQNFIWRLYIDTAYHAKQEVGSTRANFFYVACAIYISILQYCKISIYVYFKLNIATFNSKHLVFVVVEDLAKAFIAIIFNKFGAFVS